MGSFLGDKIRLALDLQDYDLQLPLAEWADEADKLEQTRDQYIASAQEYSRAAGQANREIMNLKRELAIEREMADRYRDLCR